VEEWKRFAAEQGALLKNPVAAKTAMQTKSQIVANVLKGVTNADNINDFNRRLDTEIAQLEEKTKSKASSADIRRMADELYLDGEVRGKPLGHSYDPDKRVYEMRPGEVFFLSDLDDIPDLVIDRFKQSYINSKGTVPSDEQLLEAYNNYINERYGTKWAGTK